jgi:Xaa-Pro aminopeptidase
MILSNEPGYYKEGEYGIRIENIIVVKEEENELKFENISLAPIDRDLIDSKMLNQNELDWINKYHQTVYEKLSKYLTPEEKNWLQKVTKPF